SMPLSTTEAGRQGVQDPRGPGRLRASPRGSGPRMSSRTQPKAPGRPRKADRPLPSTARRARRTGTALGIRHRRWPAHAPTAAARRADDMADPGVRRPRTLFLGSGYAGHRVRFEGLQRHTKADPRHAPRYRIVSGWQAGGSLERLPLPPGLSGRIRALQEASILTRPPRPDAIWLSASHLAAPFLWWNTGRWRRPMVVDLDWTREQQELMAADYFGRPARIGARRALGDALERWLWRGAAYFTPWSHWAADSLQRQGVRPDRIRV